MFSRFFQKSSSQKQSQPQPQCVEEQNEVQSSVSRRKFDPRVVLHYGVPSSASILAFDRVQRLLAVGTLDGRIKVFGGDNIEGILISPKQTSFKNLVFLENQGFLASVTNDNEIQIWDLKTSLIASSLKWESIITAFSIIYGTSYMFVGSEYGMVYVLKFDSEDRKIEILPYYVPTNVISEAVGMSLDNVSVVKVLHQPCSDGKRLLIAYENGVMVLWDASEDQIVLIRGHKDLELKRKKVASYPKDPKDEQSDDKLDHEEDKEICSVSWASNDGSVVAVGYVDGDIMFWDLPNADSPIDQKAKNVSNNVVKLQLSSADRRLPIIVMHWCANESLNTCGGKLFVYGGDEIGSEEVLTVLSIDWSGGIESLKCIGRIDVALRGSFADMVLLSSDCRVEGACNMLFVMTNPGQLDLYDNNSLSSLVSPQQNKTSAPTMQYPIVIPTLEPHMKTARLDVICQDLKSFRALSEILVAAKQHSAQNQRSMGINWPLTGGVPGQLSREDQTIIQIYIAGYQDGSVRIWDATHPALSLVYNIKSEVNDVKIGSAPVSALDFCAETLHLAVGDENGIVRLYGLIRSSNDTTLCFVTENGTEVHNVNQGDGPHCKVVFSLQNSAICSLQFANFGGKLAVGYEHGQVAMLDINTSSILFLTKAESDTASTVVSLNAKFSDTSSLNIPQESVSDISDNSGKGLVFIMTGDTHFIAIDTSTGNVVCNRTMIPKVKSNAISMHFLDGTSELSTENLPSNSPPKNDSEMQASIQSENAEVEVETTTTIESSYVGQIELNSLILLCYESELSLHSLKSVIEGSNNYIRKVNLVQQCCWTAVFKKADKEYVLVVLYLNGDIELRSLPTLEVLGESSLMSILRWNLKTNMEKTICSSPNGHIILVNGNETALLSMPTCENELWTLESFPCLHDEVLAAAVDVTERLSPNQNERQGSPGNFLHIAKNFIAGKAEHTANQVVHSNYLENLERLYSSPPFLKPSSGTQDPFELDIDELQIDEPVVFSSPQRNTTDKKEKGKETDRQKLFEDENTNSKPIARTTEEIKAKYRKTGLQDASTAAALAKDKLMERKEKLQLLEQRTEELQNGAQDFASMATELAKRMENRKWWQL